MPLWRLQRSAVAAGPILYKVYDAAFYALAAETGSSEGIPAGDRHRGPEGSPVVLAFQPGLQLDWQHELQASSAEFWLPAHLAAAINRALTGCLGCPECHDSHARATRASFAGLFLPAKHRHSSFLSAHSLRSPGAMLSSFHSANVQLMRHRGFELAMMAPACSSWRIRTCALSTLPSLPANVHWMR